MKQLQFIRFITGAMFLLVFCFSACRKADVNLSNNPDLPTPHSGKKPDDPGFAENNMVMYWNEKTSQVLVGPYTPPAQARYFAMIQIAVYDALNAIKPKYQRFALVNERSQSANPDAAVAAAAYWAIKGLEVEGNNPVDNWYVQSLETIPDGESKTLGMALGKKSAEAIISKRSNDNFAAANIQMPIPEGGNPGEYRSTLPFSLPNMPKIKALHQWGTMMIPFVTQSNHQFRPVAPYAINTREYRNDYNEVKLKGARVAHNRTADEDQIGKFWVERSTIGWNRFARNLINAKKIDAWKTARLLALLHTAMTDGVSGCFEAKYHYFYWRPETAIRMGDGDGNPETEGVVDWLPSYTEGPNDANPALNLYTPPIPDYPSAHANFGGAAAEILKLFFESDYVSVNQTSPTLPGIIRNYTSISQAARDNSLSRIYVGYHFRDACIKGEEQGKQIANYVFNHSFLPGE
jgi:hypothetical protein